MDHPLRVLTLNFRLGNADFGLGTLQNIEILTLKCHKKMMKVDFQT
jgi:hypothetical protein